MIFTPIQLIENNRVRLNSKIRSLLGLINGTKLYYSINQTFSDNRISNELIVCSHSRSLWKSIWTLNGLFHDKSGLLNRITEFLLEKGIDILSANSITIEQNKLLKVRIVFSGQDYNSTYDSTTAKRIENMTLVLEELKASIVANFIEEIVFAEGFNPEPNLDITRNIDLYNSSRNILGKNDLKLVDGYLHFKDDPFIAIREEYRKHYPNISSLEKLDLLPRCCITADYDSSLIRIIVFFKNTGYLHFRVKYTEQIGALSKITSVIKSRNQNILHMNVRNIDEENSIVDFLVKYPHYLDTEQNDEKLEQYIKRALYEEDIMKPLQPEFTIPKYDQERVNNN